MRPFRRIVDWWDSSLENRLRSTIIVITLFFVVLLGGFSYLVLSQNVQRTVVQTNRQFAELVAKELRAQFDDTVDNIWLVESQLDHVDGTNGSLEDALLDLLRVGPLTYHALYLFDAGGEIIVQVDDFVDVSQPGNGPPPDALPEGGPPPEDDLTDDVAAAFEGAAGGIQYVSDVFIVEHEYIPVVTVGIPVFGDDGTLERVIVASIDLIPFWRSIDKLEIGQTGRTYIVSRDGTIIAHPDRSYVGQPLAPELSAVLEGYEGSASYHDALSGREMLASFSPVDDRTGWGVVVEQERAEAFAAVNKIVIITIILILVAILTAALGTQLTSRTITHPLAELSAETRQRARTGDLSREISLDRHDEIGQVAEAFNQLMASARQTGEALRKSERRFREFFENEPEYCFIITGEGIIVDVNRAAVEAYGYPGNELVGHNILSLIDYGQHDYVRSFGDTLKGFESVRNVELTVRGKLGEKRIVLVSAKLLGQENGEIIIVQRDITARKQAEEEVLKLNAELEQRIQERTRALRQTTEHVQTILDNSPEVLLFLGSDGVVESVNPALESTFGYHPDEVIGHAPFILFDRRDAGLWNSTLREATQQRSIHRIELHACRKDGTVFDADVVLAPVKGDGELLGMVFSLRDISALKNIERMKDAIVSTAAHELRTPLTSIQGFSEILLTRKLDEKRRVRYLEFINERSNHLAAIVNDLLDISRLESGRGLEIKPEPIDLSELVNGAVEPFVETYQAHRFLVDGFPAGLMVTGDPLRLSQVITNLLSNAVKYSPDGGTITIHGAIDGAAAEISIKDNGMGISSEHLAHIFERFYRVDVSNRAIGGTGLGLTISKLIVEGHRGTIRVESRLGEGSTFTVSLPLAAADAPPETPSA